MKRLMYHRTRTLYFYKLFMLNKLLCKGNRNTLAQNKNNRSWLFCLVYWQA